MTRFSLRLLALLSFLAPARPLAVSAGPELAVPGGAPLDAAGVPAHAVARCGDGYLAAWATGGGIRAARISRTGAVLDDPPIAIAASGHGPSVASNGVSCLVAWAEDDAIWALRLALDGVPLDPAPISVTFEPFDLTNSWTSVSFPRTTGASNGGSYMIATQLFNSGNAYLAARELTADGALVDVPAFRWMLQGCTGASYDGGWSISLASAGTRYVVGYQFPYTCRYNTPWTRGVEVEFYAGTDSVLDELVFAPSAARDNALASDGVDLLAAWSADQRGLYLDPPPPGLHAIRLAGDGTFLDETPLLLSTSRARPAAQHDGIDHLVVWFEPLPSPTDAYATRIASDGTFAPAGTQALFSGAGYGLPRLATDGDGGGLLAYGVTFGDGTSELRYRILTAWSPPTAAPTVAPSGGKAPLDAQFAANAADADGDPLSYAWDFGDPASGTNTSAAANPIHRYASPGTYAVTLDVSDGHSTTRATLSVTVVPYPITLSTRLATVLWLRPAASGTVLLSASLDAPVPAPSDLVSISLDGAVVVARPFSEFTRSPLNGAYVLTTGDVLVQLDLQGHSLIVATGAIRLAGLVPSDGLTLGVRLGGRAVSETFAVTALGPLLLYRR